MYQLFPKSEDPSARVGLVAIPSLRDFYVDLDFIQTVITDGPSKSLTFRRLRYLQAQFNLYHLQNETLEFEDQRRVPHRDFYNVRKVDTHVHHSSCMNCKHLLRFIKAKLKSFPHDPVIMRDGRALTLDEVFKSLSLTAYDLSIDALDMHAHKDSFHRFDRFNAKYNPLGESRLREIFLKTDNMIKGRYLADLTREVISDLEGNKYSMAEYRLSIYGRSRDEWSKLAAWVLDNSLVSDNVRWIIQVPRLFDTYKSKGVLEDFSEMLENIFEPLFQVTQDPASDEKLHKFLDFVVGFDSVDDESKLERRVHKKFPFPKLWKHASNPPYSYYIYYLYANLGVLNQFRRARSLNTFALRPHSGEAGDLEHLIAAFMTSEGINHGILLRKVPALQYLYYLTQMHISMSPLSNNVLFLTYDRNPFPEYFARGLNVCLSTDDPLQFHFTREPLMEEYSVAAQIWKLSSVDMCEIARNSCLASGFALETKKKWLGENCDMPGALGNSIEKTNVPDRRISFRHSLLRNEWDLVEGRRIDDLKGILANPATTPIHDQEANSFMLKEIEDDEMVSSTLNTSSASGLFRAI